MNWRDHLQTRLLEIQPDSVCALDEAAQQAGHQAGVPREALRVGQALRDRKLLRGEHHEEDMGEQARRADAVRQRRDVAAVLALRQLQRLPRVEEVADEK